MLDRRRFMVLSAALAAGPSLAQQPWPNRTMTMVVPFSAGGPADLVARIAKEGMEKPFGRPVVIDNRVGAGGTVGAAAVAAAAPDGHTVGMISTGALTILPHLMANLKYDPLRDLVPVGLALTTPQILVVPPGLEANSVADLIALAKARPGGLLYGSSGAGSTPHLAAELFRFKSGIEVTHVPYRGAAPALADLLGGRIQFMLADVSAFLSQIQAGALKPLGVTSRARLAVQPGVPTMVEAGFEVLSETWYGLLAPKGTPEDRLDRLHGLLRDALALPSARKTLEDQGGVIATLDRAGFGDYIRADYARWGEIVKSAGVKLDP